MCLKWRGEREKEALCWSLWMSQRGHICLWQSLVKKDPLISLGSQEQMRTHRLRSWSWPKRPIWKPLLPTPVQQSCNGGQWWWLRQCGRESLRPQACPLGERLKLFGYIRCHDRHGLDAPVAAIWLTHCQTSYARGAGSDGCRDQIKILRSLCSLNMGCQGSLEWVHKEWMKSWVDVYYQHGPVPQTMKTGQAFLCPRTRVHERLTRMCEN